VVAIFPHFFGLRQGGEVREEFLHGCGGGHFFLG
jgi:hypothetical protein